MPAATTGTRLAPALLSPPVSPPMRSTARGVSRGVKRHPESIPWRHEELTPVPMLQAASERAFQ
jgi:hypothetical protein